MKTTIKTLENKDAGSIELSDAIYGIEARRDIMGRVVNWQLAGRRAGTHDTKEIGEISGTSKKPFKQKGTGHARQGSMRSPQFRGGAVIFGPTPRDHGYSLPRKVRQLALRMALSAKQAEGKLIVIDEAKMADHKTKALVANLAKMGLNSALFIDGSNLDENFCKAARNIPNVDVLPQQGANVYDILRRDTLVLTKNAVEQLEERLK